MKVLNWQKCTSENLGHGIIAETPQRAGFCISRTSACALREVGLRLEGSKDPSSGNDSPGPLKDCGWLRNSFRTTKEAMETRTFVGIYKGIESFRSFSGGAGFCPSWMAAKFVSHHQRSHRNQNVCWYLQGNRIIPGILRWCRILFIHSTVDGCDICSHHCKTAVETRTFVGIYRRIESFRGFLGGAGVCPSTVWQCLHLGDPPKMVVYLWLAFPTTRQGPSKKNRPPLWVCFSLRASCLGRLKGNSNSKPPAHFEGSQPLAYTVVYILAPG